MDVFESQFKGADPVPNSERDFRKLDRKMPEWTMGENLPPDSNFMYVVRRVIKEAQQAAAGSSEEEIARNKLDLLEEIHSGYNVLAFSSHSGVEALELEIDLIHDYVGQQPPFDKLEPSLYGPFLKEAEDAYLDVINYSQKLINHRPPTD